MSDTTSSAASPFGRVSSDAVQEATGRDWDGWLAVLDDAGAAGWDHPDIVRHLERRHGDATTSWWRQTIAVGFERARGLRAVGQTADAGFQVGVQRTLQAPVGAVWELLTARPQLWLGGGAPLPEKGRRYAVTAQGVHPAADGEIRVVTPERRLRLTWRPEGWDAPATLQLTLTERRPGATTLGVHLEKLPDGDAREAMREHWRRVMDGLTAAL